MLVNNTDMSAFKVEYAKSNRSGCKLCKGNISMDSLRIAAMVQSPVFDGMVPNWFHYSCFFKKHMIKSIADIGGFDSLKWDDQEKIRNKVVNEDGTITSSTGKTTVAVDPDFKVEYAKSSRSKCRNCEDAIQKDTMRIAHMEYTDEGSSFQLQTKVPRWYHIDCFMEIRDNLAASTLSANSIDGYKKLKKADQETLGSHLGKAVIGKKRGATTSDHTPAPLAKKTKEELEEYDQLKEQSNLLWKIRDALKSELNKNEMEGLLVDNHQLIPTGEQDVLAALSDCILFGALSSCPDCKEEKVSYSITKSSYTCKGSISEWTKCLYSSKEPKRKKFHLPDEVLKFPKLKELKLSYTPKQRLFPKLTAALPSQSQSQSLPKSSSAEEISKHPLDGFSVCIVGRLKRSKNDLTTELKSLGAEVVDNVSQQTTFVLSQDSELKKNSAKIQDAKKFSIPVVNIDFIEEAKKGDALGKILSSKISEWGVVPQTVISSKQSSKRKEPLEKPKSSPKITKMTVKGGGAVDPDSGLADSTHVYKVGDILYNATLGLVDLVTGANSFYKLQLLENDNHTRYYVFRAWGRVGTNVGGNKVDTYHSVNGAMNDFLTLYCDKTGNVWGQQLKKMPHKFFPLEIDYSEDVKETNLTEAGSKSKLAQEIQSLLKLIFDIKAMKQSLVEMEIDLNKMPLGKLSKNQIKEAYSLLKDLEALIDSGSVAHVKLLDYSNRFFTLIPHDFGFKSPPLLDNKELIQEKSQMLDSLLELEVTYSLLSCSVEAGSEVDPLDVYYQKLNSDLEVVDKSSDEFTLINKYIQNTHGSTHSGYKLELIDLFKVNRHGESKRFKPFKPLNNHQLLWHGSRATNFGGILSQGLRIAPPEAPCSGYMFGKGIYFADMVSKSANYCRVGPENNIGIMLLCDVALGEMYELTALPTGYHSTKGIGRTAPDPTGIHLTDDGVQIPLGLPMDAYKSSTSLLYNEFIVYDEAQVNIKYLMKMDFKFNYCF